MADDTHQRQPRANVPFHAHDRACPQVMAPFNPHFHPSNDEHDEILDDWPETQPRTAFQTQATVPLHQTQATVLLHQTQATVPYAYKPGKTHFAAHSRVSPAPPTQSTYITQPTQVVGSPPMRATSPSHIQVVASSPLNRSSPQPVVARTSIGKLVAPPGTFFQAPQPVPASQPVDFEDDNLPTDISSEDEVSMTRSNIKPTSFTSGSRPTANRVDDTPKRATQSFDVSQFMYNADSTSSAQKRPMEDLDTLSAPPRKQMRPLPKQTGPSRAMPIVDDDMTLDDIPDIEVRKKVEIMLSTLGRENVEIRDCFAALLANRSNAHLAMAELVQARKVKNPAAVASRLQPTVTKASPTKPTVKRLAQASKQTLYERWTATQHTETDSTQSSERSTPQLEESVVPTASRRLVRGRKNRSPNSSPVRVVPIVNLEDDEQEESAEEEENESGVEEVGSNFDSKVLDFFNTCSVENLSDLSNQNEDVAKFIISMRPFKALDAIRKVTMETEPTTGKKKGRGGRTRAKPVGEKVVDVCYDILQGFDAVDALVEDCEAKGRQIAQGMRKWGVNIFGASNDGELEITNIDDVIDSGIGTPSSRAGTVDSEGKEDGARNPAAGRSRSLIQKPAIMAQDLALKDYQVVGLNWLKLLWELGFSGILADDMGLGKTCQVIAFLSHLYEKDLENKRLGIEPSEKEPRGPHLIVVPGSTLENWMREFTNFSPKLKAIPYYGAQPERQSLRVSIEDDARKGKIQVLVTTYDTATKPADRSFLQELGVRACIFDEGHMLKNSQSKRYQELMKIGKRAKFRLLLTGTPLQNNLTELTSLLAFISPKTFMMHKEELEYIFKHRAKTTDNDHSALLSVQRTKRARSMMAPFVLRRKKAQVLKHLPAKTRRVEYCELTKSQSVIYNELKAQQRKVLEDRAAGIPNKDHANVLMRLRQAAIHPLLHRRLYTEEKMRKMARAVCRDPALPTYPNSVPELVYEDIEWYNDFYLHQLCEKYPNTMSKYELDLKKTVNDSGKVQKLCELLKKFKKNGDRTLIFSQFTQVMDILEKVLEQLNIVFMRLDGQTPIADRQTMLDEFTSDPSIDVFMLSTKSGGAGINLAAANKVVIFDSSFNPQDDIQAENRAHRVGQTREVEVVRLVTRGTVEEQIYALGISKLELDAMVAGDEDAKRLEQEGEDLVEQMLLEQMRKEDEEGRGDSEKGAEGADEVEVEVKEENGSQDVENDEEVEDEGDEKEEKEQEEQLSSQASSMRGRGRLRTRPKATPKVSQDVTDEDEMELLSQTSSKRGRSKAKPQAKSKEKGGRGVHKDLKEMFLIGLKKKGLDMSAA